VEQGGGGPGRNPEDLRRQRRRDGHFERIARPRLAERAGGEPATQRAAAEAVVALSPAALSAVVDGTLAKGDVLSVAELAGVVGGKRADELIPLLHPNLLSNLVVSATPERAGSLVRVRAEVASHGSAGVEMEALTAAAIAGLTVVDMVRELDPGASLRDVRIISSTAEEAGSRTHLERTDERPKLQVGRGAGRIISARGNNPTARGGPNRRTP
jgi:cyclic pyranopterin monophosphate synthase